MPLGNRGAYSTRQPSYDVYAKAHAEALARTDGELCLTEHGSKPVDLGPCPERFRRCVVTRENIDAMIAEYAGDPAPVRGATI